MPQRCSASGARYERSCHTTGRLHAGMSCNAALVACSPAQSHGHLSRRRRLIATRGRHLAARGFGRCAGPPRYQRCSIRAQPVTRSRCFHCNRGARRCLEHAKDFHQEVRADILASRSASHRRESIKPSWLALRGKVVAFRRRQGVPCWSRSSKLEILGKM